MGYEFITIRHGLRPIITRAAASRREKNDKTNGFVCLTPSAGLPVARIKWTVPAAKRLC